MARNFIDFLRKRTQITGEAGLERGQHGLMRGALRCDLDRAPALAIGADGFNIAGKPLHAEISDGVSEFSAATDDLFVVSEFGSERPSENNAPHVPQYEFLEGPHRPPEQISTEHVDEVTRPHMAGGASHALLRSREDARAVEGTSTGVVPKPPTVQKDMVGSAAHTLLRVREDVREAEGASNVCVKPPAIQKSGPQFQWRTRVLRHAQNHERLPKETQAEADGGVKTDVLLADTGVQLAV